MEQLLISSLTGYIQKIPICHDVDASGEPTCLRQEYEQVMDCSILLNVVLSCCFPSYSGI